MGYHEASLRQYENEQDRLEAEWSSLDFHEKLRRLHCDATWIVQKVVSAELDSKTDAQFRQAVVEALEAWVDDF